MIFTFTFAFLCCVWEFKQKKEKARQLALQVAMDSDFHGISATFFPLPIVLVLETRTLWSLL